MLAAWGCVCAPSTPVRAPPAHGGAGGAIWTVSVRVVSARASGHVKTGQPGPPRAADSRSPFSAFRVRRLFEHAHVSGLGYVPLLESSRVHGPWYERELRRRCLSGRGPRSQTYCQQSAGTSGPGGSSTYSDCIQTHDAFSSLAPAVMSTWTLTGPLVGRPRYLPS